MRPHSSKVERPAHNRTRTGSTPVGATTFKLYSADLRRHLETRAPYLEASGTIERLKDTDAWKNRPSVITDEAGRLVEINQVDVEHL